MKNLILLFLFGIAQLVSGQENDRMQQDTLIYSTTAVKVQPDFPGGIEQFKDFFNRNFKMPQGETVNGKITAVFVIEKDGSLSKIEIPGRVGPNTKKEAIRVLKMAPKWIPGSLNGKIVRVHYGIQFPVNNVVIRERRKK